MLMMFIKIKKSLNQVMGSRINAYQYANQGSHSLEYAVRKKKSPVGIASCDQCPLAHEGRSERRMGGCCLASGASERASGHE